MTHRGLLYPMFFLACVYGSAKYFGFYLNIGASMPKGLYRQVSHAPARGDLATSCLTEAIARYGLTRGYMVPGKCKTGIQPVMKKIIAVEGDLVEMKDGHLVINHIAYPELTIASVDRKGRELKIFYPAISYSVSQDKYVLISDYVPNSWDSRYWGEVEIEDLVALVWEF